MELIVISYYINKTESLDTRLTIVNSEMNKPYIKMAQLFHVPDKEQY